jgi:signal transduction histidine kinase
VKRRNFIFLGLEIALFVLYFSTAHLGLNVHAVNSFASLVWFPSGLSLAFLLIFGPRYWPAIAAGAFAANFVNGAPFLAAVGIAIGNTLEPLIGAYLLRNVARLRFRLDHVNDVLNLIIYGALFSTLFSAIIGTTSLWLSGTVASSEYFATTFAWWAGDAISILVVCPVLLVWHTRPTSLLSRNSFIELAGFAATLSLLISFIFGNIGTHLSDTRLRSYLMFPLFIWSAIRFGQRVTVSALFVFSAVAVLSTLDGTGPFTSGSPEQDLLNLQLFMAVLASTSMILAAAISEHTSQARQKDEFISVASHELKTPLTSMKTLTQTMQLMFEKKGDRQSSSYMKHVNRQLDRLNRLVFKMLDVTKIQEGRITLLKEKFTIGPLIREIAEEVVETTHHKIVIRGDTKTQLYADRDRIGRVLTNLMTNATKYSPDAGKIMINVRKSQNEVTVSVKDFGIGISKEDQRHIFDRYFQSSNASAAGHKKESLGLGLFISKGIVDSHGGRIWVSSNRAAKINQGSTFSFSLPLGPTKK